MMFWLINLPLYLVLLAGGMGLPGLVLWQRGPLGWGDVAIYVTAALLMVFATAVMGLLAARLLFPNYWWLGQVEGKDVFEFDGVYFLGLRLTRVPSRLQRLLFGVDEQMRSWDLIFGVMFLILLVPHTVGFFGMHRELDRIIPNPTKFPGSLHQPLLSSLPVMKQWGSTWQPDGALAKRVDAEVARLERAGLPGAQQRFELAQLYLLKAFAERTQVSDPFYDSPGEEIYFNRGHGARAVENLQVLLNLPDLQRASWSGGALTLIGFFHLSDHNYIQAQEVLQRALAELGEGDETRISRYQVLLLAAQSALMNGKRTRSVEYLELILTDERLPNEAYALAMEHYADVLRLAGEYSRVPELLGKALELYKLGEDRSGIARVHLRLAALALDEGKRDQAAEELSIASSLAQGLNDGFTLNMVAQLALAFSG
jgi:tetratricopeptide (TPR) repeat protein